MDFDDRQPCPGGGHNNTSSQVKASRTWSQRLHFNHQGRYLPRWRISAQEVARFLESTPPFGQNFGLAPTDSPKTTRSEFPEGASKTPMLRPLSVQVIGSPPVKQSDRWSRRCRDESMAAPLPRERDMDFPGKTPDCEPAWGAVNSWQCCVPV